MGQEIDDTNESLEKIVENEEQEQLTEKGPKLLSPQEVSEDEKGVVAENQDNFEEDTLEVSSSSKSGITENNVEEVVVNEKSTEKEKILLDDSKRRLGSPIKKQRRIWQKKRKQQMTKVLL